MNWAEIFTMMIMYCAGQKTMLLQDACRTQRMECVKRAVAQNPKATDAIVFVDSCLTDPTLYPYKKEEKKK